MAGTEGVVNGTLMGIYLGGTKVASLTGNGISISRPTREVANKDSGNWVAKKTTRASWGANGSGHFTFEAGGYKALRAAIAAGTRLTVLTSTDVAEDQAEQGYGFMTQLDLDFPDAENSTYSFNIDGDGELSPITLT